MIEKFNISKIFQIDYIIIIFISIIILKIIKDLNLNICILYHIQSPKVVLLISYLIRLIQAYLVSSEKKQLKNKNLKIIYAKSARSMLMRFFLNFRQVPGWTHL